MDQSIYNTLTTIEFILRHDTSGESVEMCEK